MIIDIIRSRFDQDKRDWVVETEIHDTGVSFVDAFSTPCEIDRHIPRKIEDAQKYDLFECSRCKFHMYNEKFYLYNQYDKRYGLSHPSDYKSGIWYKHECYECEDHCIISRPLNKITSCDECGGHGILSDAKDNNLEFTCEACGHEQIVV